MPTFCEYMERALYGPAGYYSAGAAKSGQQGDYFTAPDVGAVFGQLLALIFADWEQKLALPEFTLVEVGAGEGRLAKDILEKEEASTSTIRVAAVLSQPTGPLERITT